MKQRQKFWDGQQNIAAAGIAGVVFLTSLLFLLQNPRPAMLDVGRYDLLLPQLGLSRGNLYAPEEYYTRANEFFMIDQIPWTAMLQLKAGPSLVYPAAIVSFLCRLFGRPFSTLLLAIVLAAFFAVALFFLIKSLYVMIGGFGVTGGAVCGILFVCGNYLTYFNSLYLHAAFFVACTAFAAALFRGAALLTHTTVRGVSVWLPSAFTGLLVLTSSELAVVLLPLVLSVVFWLGFGSCKDSERGKGWMRFVVLVCAVFLGVCSVRFSTQNGQIFNRTNLYHSFFDGVLVSADDPEKALEAFGMDEKLAQDTGKSAYMEETEYYIAPGSEKAGEAIYSHISYGRIVKYYAKNPAAFGRLLGLVSAQAGHVDVSHSIYEEGNDSVLRADYWDLLRQFWFHTPAAFGGMSVFCLVLMLIAGARRRKKQAALTGGLVISTWLLLAAALVSCGTADIEENRLLFQFFFDAQIALGIVSVAAGVHTFVRWLAYSNLSRRQAPEPVFAAENYLPLVSAEPDSRWSAMWQSCRAFLSDSGRFAWVAAAVSFFIMGSVLFFPRIGAYNNGDFGRMMDAMGVVYTPEDYFDPEVQYEKVIERYDYLEPYDWTKIRPGRAELTQTWISAGMRMLYDLADIPFSTAVIAVFHMLVLAWCVYQLARAAHRHLGLKTASVAAGLYLLLFCGSYNMGWLNSLFGEGIAFVGMMLVAASSVDALEQTSRAGRRRALFLLACASIYLSCAKAQYALFVPFLLFWWILVALGTAFTRKSRLLTGIAALLLAVCLVESAVGVYMKNESVSSQDTLYSGLLNGILLYADSPEQALDELGLDRRLAADKGKHPYLPKEEYFCPPRTEKAEKMIYDKVSSTDYLRWYLRHPKAFWHLLDDTAVASAEPMPNFNLYVGEYNNVPHRTVSKFNVWSDIRGGLTPAYFAEYVILFGVIYLICLGQIFKKKHSARQKLYAGLLMLLIALGAIQYPLPMVGNGHSDPIKQLYLFREVYDMVFLLIVVWGVKWLIPAVQNRFGSRIRKKNAKEGEVQNAGA